MGYYHSQFGGGYRGEIAQFPGGKIDGGDFPSALTNQKIVPDKDADAAVHKGKPLAEVSYVNGEFVCRVFAQRDWHFRALDLDTLKDQVQRFFSASRGEIQFKLDRTADLARFGERAALGRL